MTRLKIKKPMTEEQRQTKLVEGMNLCTHLLFVDMYFAGTIEMLMHECRYMANELGIYKFDIKKRINNIEEASRKLMVDFRACERVRVTPVLSFTLETFVDDYRDYGKMTQRMQFGLAELAKNRKFILWNCIDNWVKNVPFPQREKEFWTKVMMMDILLASTKSFADVITEMLQQSLGQNARLDENLRYVQHLFGAMKKETECLYNKYLKSAKDVEQAQYWREQATQAQVNLNTRLLGEDAIDLANGQLYMVLKDYSQWWVARVVSELRKTNAANIPDNIDADLRKCIGRKGLVYGRFKRTLLSLAKKCKETDLLDLQDEIFDNHHTRDLDIFVEGAVLHNLNPDEADKVMKMVEKNGQQKILTL